MHCILALWQNWDVVKLLWQLRNLWSDSTLKLIELRCWNFHLWNMEKVSGDPCQSLSWCKFNSSHVWHLCVLAWVRCPDWFDPRLEVPGQWRGKKVSRRCVQKIWEVDRNSFQLHGDRHHLVFYEPLVRCLYLMCDWWHWWVWVLPVPVLKVIRSYDRVSRRVRNGRLQTGGKESANRQSPQSSENTEVEILNKVHPGTWERWMINACSRWKASLDNDCFLPTIMCKVVTLLECRQSQTVRSGPYKSLRKCLTLFACHPWRTLEKQKQRTKNNR